MGVRRAAAMTIGSVVDMD